MNREDILKRVDHTLLSQTATWEEIQTICDDAICYGTASVCIPPSYVKRVKEYVGDRMAVCTVIGFPNGYNTTAVKAFETREALKEGADEIDMVVNLGDVREGTCLLTEEEKIALCKAVTDAKADYIKTSTGFSKAGATFADVELFAAHVGPDVKIKAAGCISSFDDAEKFVSLGADRLGTSRLVKIIKAEKQA